MIPFLPTLPIATLAPEIAGRVIDLPVVGNKYVRKVKLLVLKRNRDAHFEPETGRRGMHRLAVEIAGGIKAAISETDDCSARSRSAIRANQGAKPVPELLMTS
jgi:hypothetical protein